MSDIKLFRIAGTKAEEIEGAAADLEKPLQSLIEQNLEALLGIRFLATEYSTGKTHAGRIDTLGLDEDNCPVILEYKRSSHENIINQGLFYLDWLMDHQAEFKLLVLDRFGKPAADAIDWSSPRLLCIAAEFTKFDSHAVQQMNRDIELIRYRQFGRELLLLELANSVEAKPFTTKARASVEARAGKTATTPGPLRRLDSNQQTLFESIEAFVMSLGDDVRRKDLRLYVAFRRLRNFLMVSVQKGGLLLSPRLDPDNVPHEEGFTVRGKGGWGAGTLGLVVKTPADLRKAQPLIQRAYEGTPHAS